MRFAHKCILYVHFIQQIFYLLHKSTYHWEQTIGCEHERHRSCSFNKIYNYFYFTVILGRVVLWCWIANAVLCTLCKSTNMNTLSDESLKCGDNTGSFHNFMMEKLNRKNCHRLSHLVVLLQLAFLLPHLHWRQLVQTIKLNTNSILVSYTVQFHSGISTWSGNKVTDKMDHFFCPFWYIILKNMTCFNKVTYWYGYPFSKQVFCKILKSFKQW